ncbi:MAG: hypothetical protein WD898_02735, partial [Candidatus Paceibacterota bacterium]
MDLTAPHKINGTDTKRAIENGFPIAFVSRIAEHESWRKEIYRPTNYIHKWWARRLGSVFRAIIISACERKDSDVQNTFYQPAEYPNITVFDPFMGSGAIISEAVKLGCKVIGRDINPIPFLMVQSALARYDTTTVIETFERIQRTAGDAIRSLYSTQLPDGETGEVLYYFWVTFVSCPHCNTNVDLFKRRIFATHAIPKKDPKARCVCPKCDAINECRFDSNIITCTKCQLCYDPQKGVVVNKRVACQTCHKEFTVIDAVRQVSTPPNHRMYAKLVLRKDGKKQYYPIDASDIDSYSRAGLILANLRHEVPKEAISAGYNTNQVLRYNYSHWHQMFNERQLASFALLAGSIKQIVSPELKILFSLLLSSTLEFNNMFCSFKGEGTGAIRPLFSHHILKPELTPLEGNVWGTIKSSGSFSTLFKSRILRAIQYRDTPFEFQVFKNSKGSQNRKFYGLSRPLQRTIAKRYAEFEKSNSVYLSCADSAKTDLPTQSVDLIVTDPPFFDNVHYSELADFFYVWIHKLLGSLSPLPTSTTRSPGEVQDSRIEDFRIKLCGIFKECHRVMKRDGLLIFTYHHSRIEGWVALYEALSTAGFEIACIHPVKSEMAVSIP